MENSVLFTSSVVWTVPLDWSRFNTITVVGAGQGGGSYYRWDGGNQYVYGYGGAGGGYAKIENLNSLVPGQTVVIQVGAGGFPASSGSGPGGSGSSSSFGGYVTASAGITTGPWPYMSVGNGGISAPAGSYTNAVTSMGSLGSLYVGGNPGYGGNAGSPGYGSYGKGGNSQNWYSANYPYTGAGALPARPGQNGVILVTYIPSGTQQPCVWIS